MITLLIERRKSIFRLVSLYSFILIFPAFGPGLKLIMGAEPIGLMSATFLFFLAIGLIFKYHKIVKIKYIYEVIIILLTIAFYWSGNTLRMIELAVMGVLLARLVLDWIYCTYDNLGDFRISWFFGIVLALSYGGLYLGNVVLPMVSEGVGFILVLLVGCTMLINKNIGISHATTETIKPDKHLPKILITILIIYIAAGTTYNSIYPALVMYDSYEHYFNVVPFIPVALIGAYFVGKHTMNLLYIGIILLGLSVISLFITHGPTQYFVLQGFIQSAWALLDLFAWVAGARYALSHNNPRVQALLVAAFLLGTTFGSLLSEFYGSSILVSFTFQHALLTLLPLFISLLIIGGFRLFDSDIEVDRLLKRKRIIDNKELTPREREIAMHLIHDYTYSEISEELNISINTLKTHTKSIYRKLDIHTREQLGIEE